MTATLTGSEATPTGTVIFLNGTTSLGTGIVNGSGVADLTVTTLPVGTNSITAHFEGDGNYTEAISAAVIVTVNPAAQTITFAAPSSPVTYGVSPITLSATASSGLAVTFSATGPATVNGNTLRITGAGAVVVTAHQDGDTEYSAANTVSRAITVDKTAPSNTLTSSAGSITAGSSVTFTATLTGNGVAYRHGNIPQWRQHSGHRDDQWQRHSELFNQDLGRGNAQHHGRL